MARIRTRRKTKLQRFKEIKPKEKVSLLVRKKKKVVNWQKVSNDSAYLDLVLFKIYAYKDEIETDRQKRDMYKYRYLSNKSSHAWVSLRTAMRNAELHLLEKFNRAVKILEDRDENILNEEYEELFSDMEFSLTLLVL